MYLTCLWLAVVVIVLRYLPLAWVFLWGFLSVVLGYGICRIQKFTIGPLENMLLFLVEQASK